MQKVEKILVPINFSEESADALRDAVSLMRDTKAALIALHVVDVSAESDFLLSCIMQVEGIPLQLSDAPKSPLDMLRQARTLNMRNFVDQTVGVGNHEAISIRVHLGDLAREIAAVIREDHIDLLVLKLRKRFLFPDLGALKLLRIARRLRCPVLVGPPVGNSELGPKGRRIDFRRLHSTTASQGDTPSIPAWGRAISR